MTIGVKWQLLFVAKQQQQQQQQQQQHQINLNPGSSPSVLLGFHFVGVTASQPEATDLNSSRCHAGGGRQHYDCSRR